MTTPELYPLSVNSLLSACNQKSSRDPVVSMTEEDVRKALDTLEALELVSTSRDGRVPRFEHRIRTVLQLRRDETALLGLLLLRGPQTSGELRARSDRMFQFDDPAQVQGALERLAARPDPLVVALLRSPGSREGRWTHLLGKVAAADTRIKPEQRTAPDVAMLLERIEALEDRGPKAGSVTAAFSCRTDSLAV